MARIRTIKPEFWTDEKVVELSAFARLLFIGIWNFCDDDGRMVYSPKRIKMQIFPSDSLDCSELIGEIRGKSLVDVYSVEDVEYLQVVGFTKHQKVDKRTPSKLPPSPNPPESPRIVPTEGNGMEGIKEGNGCREMTHSEKLLRECINDEDKQALILKNYPLVNMEIEIEEIVSKYKNVSIGADPWLIVSRWLKLLKVKPVVAETYSPVTSMTVTQEDRERHKRAEERMYGTA